MLTWCWRIVHRIQQWSEDRNAPEYGYVKQWRKWWEPERPKVVPFKNLLIVRGQRTTGRRIAS